MTRWVNERSQSGPTAPTTCFSIHAVCRLRTAPSTSNGNSPSTVFTFTRWRNRQYRITPVTTGIRDVTVLLNRAHAKSAKAAAYHAQSTSVETDVASASTSQEV